MNVKWSWLKLLLTVEWTDHNFQEKHSGKRSYKPEAAEFFLATAKIFVSLVVGLLAGETP